MLLVTLGVGIGLLLPRGRSAATQEEWARLLPRMVALKAEAERMALAGKLQEAHAKYSELEQFAGGRAIKDSGIHEIVERAKQDQDQLYGLLLMKAQNELLAQRQAQLAAVAAAPNPNLPREQYPADLALLKVEEPPAKIEPVIATRPVLPATTQSVAVLEPPASRPVVLTPATTPSTLPSTRPTFAATKPATRPATAPAADPIDLAIARGANYLMSKFLGDQIELPDRRTETYREGVNALCVYALLEAGRVTRDERLHPRHPFMQGLIERMKQHLLFAEEGELREPLTYAHSLRVAALSVYNRPQDRAAMEADVYWLVRASTDGAYTYIDALGRNGRLRDRGGNQRDVIDPALFDSRQLYYFEPSERTLFHNGEGGTPVRRPAVDPPAMGRPVIPPVDLSGSTGQRISLIPDYAIPEPANLPWDNSNSCYGLFGVWCGAESGIPIPQPYWIKAEQHWLNCQLPTAQWGYDGRQNSGSYAMTVGGAASLLAAYDYLDAPEQAKNAGKDPYSQPLAMALAWLEKGDNSVDVGRGPVQYLGYNLFGLSRAALACGYRHFGAHDWYRELAAKTIASQFPNGAWGRKPDGNDTLIDTAYVVLFLSRGRQPVMVNKLRFDGSWNNRARDVANLSRFASIELERPLRWQVVGIDRPWKDWADAPVLFISSHQPPKLTDDQCARLREYALAGGTIFTHADGGSASFNTFADALAKQLFPGSTLAPLPRDHALYTINYRLANKPELRAVTSGKRILMLHSPRDLTQTWQSRDLSNRAGFELGVNLYVYVVGKDAIRK